MSNYREANRDTFIEILKSIKREYDFEGLVKFLDDGGFFDAPASSQYHSAFDGGLCFHSLEVYTNLVKLCKTVFEGETVVEEDDTLKIVALFHDIAKMNLYEKTAINEKCYCDTGTSVDAVGRFNWVSKFAYKTKSIDSREVYGDKCFTAYFLLSRYMPLTDLELIVLANQYSAFDSSGCSSKELSALLGKYPLVALLHSSDVISTYITESKYEQGN